MDLQNKILKFLKFDQPKLKSEIYSKLKGVKYSEFKNAIKILNNENRLLILDKYLLKSDPQTIKTGKAFLKLMKILFPVKKIKEKK